MRPNRAYRSSLSRLTHLRLQYRSERSGAVRRMQRWGLAVGHRTVGRGEERRAVATCASPRNCARNAAAGCVPRTRARARSICARYSGLSGSGVARGDERSPPVPGTDANVGPEAPCTFSSKDCAGRLCRGVSAVESKCSALSSVRLPRAKCSRPWQYYRMIDRNVESHICSCNMFYFSCGTSMSEIEL